MITILLILTLGILVGLVLANKRRIHLLNNHLLNMAIYLLLFLLGISVGTNQTVIENIGKIGLEAVAIAIASIAGSVLLCAILFKFFFHQDAK